MSNLSALETVRPLLDAIPAESIKSPDRPVEVYVNQAYKIAARAVHNRAAIEATKFDWSRVEQIPLLCGALREVSSAWDDVQFKNPSSMKQWLLFKTTGEKLFYDLVTTSRFVFRKNDAELAQITRICDGASNASLLQNLNDIAVFGRERTESFAAVDITMKQFEEAAELSVTMSNLLATATVDKESANEKRILRDRAYTALKIIIDDLIAHARYALRNDKDVVEFYTVEYTPRKSRTTKTNATAATTAVS